MQAFKDRGVKFDYSEEDEKLFYKLHEEIGSEYAYISKQKRVDDRQHTRLVECEKCGVATSQPVEVDGHFYHEACAKTARPVPKVPPQLQRTEKKTYKETPEYRRAQMRPRVSKMEDAIRLRLQEKGISFQAQREFCIQTTTPDFYFPAQNLAVYLDGEHVHQKREAKDEFLREKLQKRHHIRAVAIVYKDNSKKSEDEIFEKLVGAAQGEQ